MIDIRRLKELVKLMVENELSELDLRDQEETVTIKRGGSAPAGGPFYVSPPEAGSAAAATENGAAKDPGAAAAGAGEEASTEGLVPIESPMVGTFYSAPNPDSEPFVTPGQNITGGTVVCLVEAMKVFNEIKSEVDGVIERVLVKNGDAVEFGQQLFLVRPTA